MSYQFHAKSNLNVIEVIDCTKNWACPSLCAELYCIATTFGRNLRNIQVCAYWRYLVMTLHQEAVGASLLSQSVGSMQWECGVISYPIIESLVKRLLLKVRICKKVQPVNNLSAERIPSSWIGKAKLIVTVTLPLTPWPTHQNLS